MSLKSGTLLGPYEVGAPLGAGGMGEVYRARDTRLERDVAVKILPAEFSLILFVSSDSNVKPKPFPASTIRTSAHCTTWAARMASPTSSWSAWREKHWPSVWKKGRCRSNSF